ncbi:ATP-dependent DNA helicase [Opacimonas viscosa]|uniref:ATP-dependent RecD-like DNA helicase n=1 Tax=Opacimonas viscosa TaxID=2961944 RepID=A0AA41X0N3_9ALTE|nr:ATP-dependent RecD-like DNA helicase [Opacimonas viscosa]MCP3429755.1 ATP-dependent RecD-like DNA helicase [Opacimonas viscosa]
MEEVIFAGTISNVLYSHENQQVFRVNTQKKAIKVLLSHSHAHFEEGEHVQVIGQTEFNYKYGEQVIASSVELCDVSNDLIKSFLISTNGVGEKTANKLIVNLGNDLLNLIEKRDVSAIKKQGNVSKTIAEVICFNWHKQAGKVELIKFIREVLKDASQKEVSAIIKIAKKAYSFYGDETENKLRDDPYRIWAFGTFKQAEIFASALKIKKDDKRRLVCAVEDVLFTHLKRGSTQASPLNFSKDLEKLVGKDLVIKAIVLALDQSKTPNPRIVVTEPQNFNELSDTDRLYSRMFALPSAVIMENYVREQIKTRLMQGILNITVSDSELEDYTLPGGHNLSHQQREAVKVVLTNAVSCVSGGAGTGKTSVLYCAHNLITNAGNSVLQVALSGKASRRLAQQTEQDAMTIEKLLKTIEYNPDYLNQFQTPLVLIDEASMVDIHSMYRILKVLEKRPARLVFVGDWAQLSPVGPGLVYHKLMESEFVPKVELTQNFRSTKNILEASDAIKAGKTFEHSKEVNIIECSSLDEMEKHSIRQYELHLSAQSMHIIAARTRTVATINLQLHKLITKNRKIVACAPHFRVGDSVVYKANNEELGIVNGSTGVVIGGNDEIIEVDFDIEGLVVIPKEQITNNYAGEYLLQHGYALTCHASQGSEFDVVIVVVENFELVDRSWLYTAITRAKRKVIVLTMPESINNSLKRGFNYKLREVGFEI